MRGEGEFLVSVPGYEVPKNIEQKANCGPIGTLRLLRIQRS